MKIQLHYCSALKALTARVHVGQHTFGADVYLMGLTLWRWRGTNEEYVLDLGKVG